jgi:predicted alternative tryptophan synthase beta-subunit
LLPIGPDDLAPLFPMDLIRQEVTTERYVDIPEEVLDVYRLWRPSPSHRAHRLEKALGTPAKIFYKYEGGSPAGSHKPNTACFEAGVRFARTEGIVPAPEPTHALAACAEEALRCRETGEEKVILTALCGHGHLDLAAYGAYLAGDLDDHELSESQLAASVSGLPVVPDGPA